MPLDAGSHNIGSDIIASAIVILLYASAFGFAEILRRRFRVEAEITRKVVHVAGGFIAVLLPFIFDSPWPVVVLGLLFFVVLAITRRSSLLGAVQGVNRATAGEIFYPLALATVFLLAWLTSSFPFYVAAILVLAIADSAAWLVGSRYSRTSFRIFGDRKSGEGSFAFLVVAWAFNVVFLGVHGVDDFAMDALVAFVVAAMATIAEALSPRGSDNLTVPLVTWGGLMWLG